MISSVQDVYYNVSDMSRAIRFYGGVLGLMLEHQSKQWSSVNVGGVQLGLHWTGGDPVPDVPGDAHGPYAGAQIKFRVDDIHAAARHLEAAGARVLSEVWDRPWGKLVVFRDPDGNYLTLMQPRLTSKQGRAG